MIGEFIKEQVVITPVGYTASFYDMWQDYLNYCEEYELQPETETLLKCRLMHSLMATLRGDKMFGVASHGRPTRIKGKPPAEVEFMQEYLTIRRGAVTPTSEVYQAYNPDGSGTLTQDQLTRKIREAFKDRVQKRVRTVNGARVNCFVNLKVI